MRLGEILKAAGLITDRHISLICRVQQQTGEPFGVLAEQMLGISGDDIVRAWQEHNSKHMHWIDLGHCDEIDPYLLGRFDEATLLDLPALPLKVEYRRPYPTLQVAVSPVSARVSMRYFWRKWIGRQRFFLADETVIKTVLRRSVNFAQSPQFAQLLHAV